MKKKNLMVGMILFIMAQNSYAQDIDKFQALFITKFVEYVKWPSSEKIVIGVYGNDNVFGELSKMLAAKNKNLSVKNIASTEDARSCQAVFLASKKDKDFDALQSAISGKSVLLITESESYAKKGAGISFYSEGQKMRFKINPKIIEANNLMVSSNLLAIGTVVE